MKCYEIKIYCFNKKNITPPERIDNPRKTNTRGGVYLGLVCVVHWFPRLPHFHILHNPDRSHFIPETSLKPISPTSLMASVFRLVLQDCNLLPCQAIYKPSSCFPSRRLNTHLGMLHYIRCFFFFFFALISYTFLGTKDCLLCFWVHEFAVFIQFQSCICAFTNKSVVNMNNKIQELGLLYPGMEEFGQLKTSRGVQLWLSQPFHLLQSFTLQGIFCNGVLHHLVLL